MVFGKLKEKLGLKKEETRFAEARRLLTEEAGLVNLFNVDDTDKRSADIKETLTNREVMSILFEPLKLPVPFHMMTPKQRVIHVKMSFVRRTAKKLFALYFYAGNPYYRGLDNRELAEKVAFFLMNYTEVGHLPEFVPDLFEEAMQLLSLSWQEKDVTHTPIYIVESRKPNVVVPNLRQRPDTELDYTGMMQMNQRMQEMEAELEQYRSQNK